MSITWAMMKDFLDEREASPQFVEFTDMYLITAIDGPFEVTCVVYKDGGAEVTEFEADYKPSGNAKPKTEVVTQFEKNDKDLKVACGSGAFDGTTKLAVAEIPSPPGSTGRYIESGLAFVDDPHAGDKIEKIEAVDTYGTYSGVAGYVLKTYHDDDQATDHQGWFIPAKANGVTLDTMAGYGFVPPGVTLKVTARSAKADPTGDFLRVNIKWGRLGT